MDGQTKRITESVTLFKNSAFFVHTPIPVPPVSVGTDGQIQVHVNDQGEEHHLKVRADKDS